MLIGIIGSNGFVGSSLVEYLTEKGYNVISIDRVNYNSIKNKELDFDVLINCSGNSNKRIAEQNPSFSLNATVKTIYDIAKDFKTKKYIYISSIDTEIPSVYGEHKIFAEQAIQRLYQFQTSLRCGAIIGKNAKKGLVYDISHEQPIYLTSDSTLQLLDIKELALFITLLFNMPHWNWNFYCWSPDNITPDEVGKILGKEVKYHKNLEYQNYIYQTDYYYKFQTCEKALQSYKEEL
jgi:nucleoside-diphosphate-sugar epimerase